VPDGPFIDYVIESHLRAAPCDYTETTTSGTFPYGLSVEVCSMNCLDAAWNEASAPEDREHVTRYIRLRPDRFPQQALSWEDNSGSVRVTIDQMNDLARMRAAFAFVGYWNAGWKDVVQAVRTHPEWAANKLEVKT